MWLSGGSIVLGWSTFVQALFHSLAKNIFVKGLNLGPKLHRMLRKTEIYNFKHFKQVQVDINKNTNKPKLIVVELL